MSTLDRAADVIRTHGTDTCQEPECIAQDLADAGLLAPDTPEPDGTSANGTPVWRSDRCLMTTAIRKSNQVRLWIVDVGEVPYSPQDARQQAYMLLAAANHAEQAKTPPNHLTPN